MRIKSIKINEFGILKNISRNFSDGISVIYGENEAGKTTMALFIRCMLYGVTNTKKYGNLNLRKRILPFSGTNASGSMAISHQGTDYLISRVFGQTSKNDTLKITNLSTGAEFLTDKEPGETFMDMDESVFLRSLYIDEKDSEINAKNTEELKTKLTNIVISGDQETSFKKAEKELSEEIKSISNNNGRGKPGSADLLIKELDVLKEELSVAILNDNKLADENEKLKSVNYQINSLKEEKAQLESEKASLKNLKMREDYSDFRVLIDRADYLNKEIERNKQGMNSSELSAFVTEFRDLTSKYNEYKSTIDQYNEMNSKLEIASADINHKGTDYFSKENEKSVRQAFDEISSMERIRDLINYPERDTDKDIWIQIQEYNTLLNKQNRISMIRRILNLIFFIPIITLFATKDNGIIVAVLLIIPIIYVLIKVLLGKKYKEIKVKLKNLESIFNGSYFGLFKHTLEEISKILTGDESIKNEFLKSNNKKISDIRGKLHNDFTKIIKNNLIASQTFKLDDYLGAEEDFNSSRFELNKLQMEVSDRYPKLLQIKSSLDEENKRLEIKLKKIKKEDLFNGINHRAVTDELENMLVLQKITEEKSNELVNTTEKIKAILEREEIVNVDSMIEAIQNEIKTEEKLDSKIMSILQRIHDKEKEQLVIANEIEKFESNKRPGELTAIIEYKTSELHELMEKKRIAELALSVLRECNDELERDFLPLVSNKIEEIFRNLTSGRHSNIIMDNSFNISYEDKTGFVSSDYLSRGTKDLLWFGLRMSIYDILKNGDETPLIFDDSFIHMDDIRLESVLSYLKQIAERAQILIFTCQTRVEKALENLA